MSGDNLDEARADERVFRLEQLAEDYPRLRAEVARLRQELDGAHQRERVAAKAIQSAEWLLAEQESGRLSRARRIEALHGAVANLTADTAALRAERDTLRQELDKARAQANRIFDSYKERLAERDTLRQELDRWESGQRRKGMPHVEQVPDAIAFAANLAREHWDDSLSEHAADLLVGAAQRIKILHDTASALIAERDTLATRLAQVETERDAMRAVVDAAKVMHRHVDAGSANYCACGWVDCPVLAAVDAYRATGTTTEGT